MSKAGAEEDVPQAGPFRLWLSRAIGWLLIGPWFRLVRATSRVVYDPPDFWQRIESDWPAIVTAWHGHHYLTFPILKPTQRFAYMISAHPDGQLAAGMAHSFGFGVITGSGASDRQRHGTGGVAAFRQTLRELSGGRTAVITADVPPIQGRDVSRGLIAIAKRSGRPVFAVAAASSRRVLFTRVWDRMQFNFPFSRIAIAWEGPFDFKDQAVSEDVQIAQLGASLDRVLDRAFALADGKTYPAGLKPWSTRQSPRQ